MDTVPIPLTQGKVAIIDAEDHERVAAYFWYAMKHRQTYYAARKEYFPDGSRATVLLHRFIMNARPGELWDHKDRNGLNCQRSNLRPATVQQNTANTIRARGELTPYRGVNQTSADRFAARIEVAGKRIYIGKFSNAIEAAHAYDRAAREHFGEFALLNFP